MNIPYCLRRAEMLYGDHPAILDHDRTITYREFGVGVRRGAARLHALGIARGDRVAVLMVNSPRYYELYFSVPMAGALIVPVNTRWNVEDVLFVLRDSGSNLLLVDEQFLTVTAEIRKHIPGIMIAFAGKGDCPAAMEDYRLATEPMEFPEPDPEDLLGLFYTSGTTGGPKGVMLTHRNVLAHSLAAMLEDTFGGKVLLCLPMFHIAGAAPCFPVMLGGGSFHFLPGFEPAAVLSAIERHRAEVMCLVPSMWAMLLHHPDFDRTDLSSLHKVLWAASPMPIALQELLIRKLPGRRYGEAYGLTEISGIATITFRDQAEASVGRPACSVEVRVVGDDDRLLPPGQAGEVVVRGDTVMKGYWNRPEVNREVLRNGWLHTGDIGRFDAAGNLYILDRKKDMIKTGGENVFCPEVEGMLMSHPAVLEAAVIGVAHEKWGETIRAMVALKPGVQLSEPELIAWCRERMTHFKCPTSVEFLEALPKTASGKVQKPLLRSRAASAAR